MRALLLAGALALLTGCGASAGAPDASPLADTPQATSDLHAPEAEEARPEAEAEAAVDARPKPADATPDPAPEPAGETGDESREAGSPDTAEPATGDTSSGEADPFDSAPADPGPPTPPAVWLTVDAIPAAMNGSEPFLDNDGLEKAFHLAVPLQGFTLDLTLTPGGAPIDPATLIVTADVAAGDLPAGTDLGPRFAWTDPTHATWRVDLAFPVAWPVTVRARVSDQQGTPSPEAAFSFEVRELTPALDPFEQPDLWLLDLRRDAWAVTVTEQADAFAVTSTPGANGVADFDEVLAALGLLGPDPAFDQAFLQRFRDEVRANLHTMFGLGPDGLPGPDGVRVAFSFDTDPDAPDPAAFAPDGAFSMIAIGGDSLSPDGTPTGYLGMSWLDWNNTRKDDDTGVEHGVFFTALMRKTASLPGLKPLLGLTVPATGTPLGGLPDDVKLLDPTYSPPNDADPLHKKRATLVKLFFKVGGIGLAALTAHEIGHSLGLVAPGAPPAGLFGGACQAAFVNSCSDGAHVDTAGANLMQSGKSLNVGDFLTSYPRFEPLSLAYLRRRLVVDPVF